eukprot:SAG11_NODE_10712_length_810_cov_1.458509_2_plen_36_part_01
MENSRGRKDHQCELCECPRAVGLIVGAQLTPRSATA